MGENSHYDTPKAYSVSEAMLALAIGKTTLYKAIKTGQLRAVKCGRRTLILRDDLDAFLASLQEVEASQC